MEMPRWCDSAQNARRCILPCGTAAVKKRAELAFLLAVPGGRIELPTLGL